MQRVRHANRGRLLLRTPGPVLFGICICSTCWDQRRTISMRHYTSLWQYYRTCHFTESEISPDIGFHRASATGVACRQGTLTPPDTWSCPTLGLAWVLMSRPISPEFVLSPDLWISNTPRYFSFAFFLGTTIIGIDNENIKQKIPKSQPQKHNLIPHAVHPTRVFKRNCELRSHLGRKFFIIDILFSEEGVVYCINTVISGSTFYTTVMNPGTVDEVNTFRFTCYVSIVQRQKWRFIHRDQR